MADRSCAAHDPKVPRVPLLIKFLGMNLMFGLAIGVAFTSIILSSNAVLRDLIAGTDQPWIALVMLFVMNALTFGSLAMGVGVMLLPLEPQDDTDPSGRNGGNKIDND